MNDSKMTPTELKATWGLGAVFTLRMLGMFMVLPILASYGRELKDANEFCYLVWLLTFMVSVRLSAKSHLV